MTIDEAKRALEVLRGSKAQADFMDEALDVALWLMEREHHLEWMKQHLPPDLDRGAFAARVEAMWKWESENPKPSEGA